MRTFQFKLCRLAPRNASVNRIGTIITHGWRRHKIQHRYIFIEKGKPLASVVETESYVRKFTSIVCEMRSMIIYITFAAKANPKDAFVWLAVTSTAINAVHAMKLAVTKKRRAFDPLFVLLSRILRNAANITQ